MSEIASVTLAIGAAGDTDADREQQASDLAHELRQAGIEDLDLEQSSSNPKAMAVGEILTLHFAAKAGRKLYTALRNWLLAQRTEVEIRDKKGRVVKINAANIEDAKALLEQVSVM